MCSAKTNVGVEKVLDTLIETIPSPNGDIDAPLQALIIDSWFDNYLGVVSLIRIKQGTLRRKDKIYIKSVKRIYSANMVGIFTPKRKEIPLSHKTLGFSFAEI